MPKNLTLAEERELFRPLMKKALKQAAYGFSIGEVPVGALVIDSDLKIVSSACNLKEAKQDPLAHAEVVAIRKACREFRTWNLSGMLLVSTLEPCLICASVILTVRISKVVFGSYDPKCGACGSLYNFFEDPRLNHRVEIVDLVEADLSKRLLKDFFKKRRR